MGFLDKWDTSRHPLALFTCSRSDEAISTLLDDDFNFECCLRLLSLKDQVKVRSVKHNKKHALLTRLFMKAVLNSVTGKTSDGQVSLWQELDFEYSEHGKPELRGRPFAFNNSNSDDLACIAVSFGPGAIGVDISHEEQDSISPENVMEEFHGIFSESERGQLQSLGTVSDRYFAFNHLWTLKEAFTKYLGTGLNIDLSSFSFTLGKLGKRAKMPQESQELFISYPIEWSESDIDTGRVRHENLPKHRSLYCSSGVLKESEKLPVIVSVITEAPSSVLGIHVDLYELLKREIAS